jgi:hypothetical protein
MEVGYAQVIKSEHLGRRRIACGLICPFFVRVAKFLDEIRNGGLQVPGLEGSRPTGVAVGGAGAGGNLRPLMNRLCAS